MKYKQLKRFRLGWGQRLMAVMMIAVILAGLFTFSVQAPKASAAIAFVSSSNALNASATTSLVVNAPAGLVAGQVLIAHTMALAGSANAVTTSAPAGWVAIGSPITGNKYAMTEFYKITTAGEPASYTFTFAPASTAAIAIGAFSGADTKAPIDVQTTQINASSTNAVAPSISATYNNDFVLPLWGFQANTPAATFPAGVTSMWNTSTTNNGIAGAYLQITNAGATGTFTATTAAATASFAHTIGLKSASAAAGVQFIAASTPVICAACTTQVAPAPNGWKAGDLLLTNVTWNGAATVTPPAGWTQIDTTLTSTTYRSADYYHFALSTDPNSYTWTFSAIVTGLISTADFAGVDDAQPIDVTASSVDAAAVTTHTAPSLTTNFAQDMLVTTYGFNNKTTISSFSASMTQLWNLSSSNANGANHIFGAYELLGLSGATGTRNAVSSAASNAMMHSIALKAFLPSPILVGPSSGIVGTPLRLALQIVNISLGANPLKYKIQLCSTATCSSVLTTFDQTISQAGWSGQDASAGTAYIGATTYGGSTTATYTMQSDLTPCTQYYWRGTSFDTVFTQLSNPSNINSFKTSCVPSAPTLFTPANGGSNVPLNPFFILASTDADGDYLQYRIQLCSDAACATVLNTFDQTISQAGWSGQDNTTATGYVADILLVANSTKGYYTFTTGNLKPSTVYYWRATAKDPAGTNLFSAASAISSFTTNLNETRILNGSIKSGRIL